MAKEIIIDATNATLGRLASYAAKQALRGNKIIILNSEKSIITGRRKFTIQKYKEKMARGGISHRGPFFPKTSDKIVKRTIRGMLPSPKIGRARPIFKKILCYNGIPEEYKDKKAIKAGKEKSTNFVSVEQLLRQI